MAKQAAVAPTRTRARPLQTEAAPPPAAGHNLPGQPTPSQRALAETFYVKNAGMNVLKRESEKARKDLFTSMKELETLPFEHSLVHDGKTVIVDVEVMTPVQEKMDPGQLWVLLGCEDRDATKAKAARAKFVAMVSVTKEKVVQELGGAVATRIAVPVDGTECVTVKARK